MRRAVVRVHASLLGCAALSRPFTASASSSDGVHVSSTGLAFATGSAFLPKVEALVQ